MVNNGWIEVIYVMILIRKSSGDLYFVISIINKGIKGKGVYFFSFIMV